jgi:predicted nuclease of predicted toxin-antitoxin system
LTRFLVDACVDVRVSEWLRERGHDSTHLRDQQLQHLADPRVFEKAASEARVIVTLDLDFGEIVGMSGLLIVSAIVFRVHDTRGEFLTQRLEAVLPRVGHLLEAGAIVLVEEARYRVRNLPLRTR